ncbi:TetR/AcrR family transcriptional regulator [Spirosoma validum]|uniref:TetR/AcrR family transcriptional regulator n=1 Tax=Spirosoma validum TaxID=2771355 RepID=UPI001CC27197|nr:TetR/AcrR family transcriptional regulator [Spirosoma validum]
MEIIKRNRAATIERIVNALEQVLAQDGLEGLYVSVSKVLVYRYFGSIDGLLEYYVRLGRVVPNPPPDWLKQIQPAHP